MPRKPPHWKEFELAVTEIRRQLAPLASVHHDVKLLGRSGRKRQFDVVATQKVGVVPVTVVFECKRYGRSVEIRKVEAFSRKLRDVGAAAGVMVSTFDFDEGARRIAEIDGIFLISAREATRTDWERLFGNDAWATCVVRSHTVPRCQIVWKEPYIAEGLTPTDQVWTEHNGTMCVVGPFEEIFLEQSVSQMAPPIGQSHLSLVPETPAFMAAGDAMREIASIELTIDATAKAYPINLAFKAGHILSGADGALPKVTQVFSEGFNWQDIIATNPGTEMTHEELDQLPGSHSIVIPNAKSLKPFLRLVMTHQE